MKLSLACVWILAVATGCKTDAADAPAAGSAATTTENTTAHPRSGKIDLPRRRPELSDSGSGSDERRDRRDEAKGRWADMRAQRQTELDTNKDGTVSPEELAAGRQHRAETMRTRLDKDGDGKLTPAELGESRMARRIEDLSAVDTDKDGNISPEELSKALGTARAGRRGPWGGATRGSDEADPL